MALTIGTHLGFYEITALLGKGGMGEVYRAHDKRLDRSVAIKVLSSDLAGDVQFCARFQREARVLASLSHPNIAAVYGLEESAGRHLLVMELITGETLSARLARGKLTFEETVRIGAQIADALAVAHAKGIIHRDLKPGNVMITKSIAKVLDFGLAKSVEDETLTASRVVMGTPAYMAPEQRAGKACDARTDIYALGLLLYEMATGKKFSPEAPRIESIPEKFAHVLERCLEKDPDDRWQTAADLKKELAWSANSSHTPPLQGQSSFRGRTLAVAAVIACILAAVGVVYFRATIPMPMQQGTVRLSIPQFGATAITISGATHDLTLTPDGSRIVYVGNDAKQLFVRSLDALEPVAIASGTALQSPFVSPDGQWVGYLDSAYVMKKVAVTGGAPITLAGRGRFGATWLTGDTIVYGGTRGLSRISAVAETSNETPEVLTHTVVGETSHLWPEVLPDNRGILFTISKQTGGLDASQIAVFDLRTRKQKILLRGGSAARYFVNPAAPPGRPSGYLVYVAGGMLRSILLDLDKLETKGTATAGVPVLVTDSSGDADFAVDTNGTLVYVDAPASVADVRRSLVWVDRTGKEEIAGPPGAYLYAVVSPDESRIALIVVEGGERKLAVWDLRRKAFTRLTFDLGRVIGIPIWTPDGKRIIFQASVGNETVSMWWMAADGTGAPERMATSRNPQLATSITSDGRHLVYHEATPDSSIDILQMTLDGTQQITPLLHSKSWEQEGMVSPDGRWLAYECCAEKQPEIWVSPFPNVQAGRWQLSTGGGRYPVWSPTNKELFFIAADASIMSVTIEASGSAWQAGQPTKLFDSRYFKGYERSYDVSRDGRRLLLIKPPGNDSSTPPTQIIVVQHWDEELRRLFPAK